ncbi:hypothetical protein B484DRAFT_449092 [Ochromonadaceae sp. CCMP2298]|nr:hypothetical protein B484DRAFT_449092 [Ochromonadaceae sp. CCMP2298]|mmetsp:Transcript_27088/g.59909  ORF Transcript_27088/g.59909 Transcript_27088/m.59909 type:complete len:237 (+) Transcript_27088:142-852(+)
MMRTLLTIACATLLAMSANARGAGECAALCNDLRFEVLTLEMCREAKKTLPRPKVGDFCSNAMEQGFSDSCVALCMNERPVPRVAQTCRAAAIEMPRPTVRRWCEHGYNVAFEKTTRDLKQHFKVEPVGEVYTEPVVEKQPEPEVVAAKEAPAPAAAAPAAAKAAKAAESSLRGRNVAHTIPITMEDETKDLVVYEGQNAEEAVVAFCRENLPDDVSTCIRELLSTVIEKMEGGTV